MNRSEPNLRTPGPTMLPDSVREAGARQMINHRGPAFEGMFARVAARMQPFFGTRQEVLLLTAAGTGGLEAAIVNTLSPGDRVLSVVIGVFGERFATIAETYGADVTRLTVEFGQAADPDRLAEALRAAPGWKAVLLTHNETSTGVENPIAELAATVHREAPEALVLVDGVSALGAVPFEMDAWGLDTVTTGSQKSWMVPPGMSMVALSDRAWEATSRARMPRFYLDLNRARKSGAKNQTPWTPAVGILFQLDESTELMEREGAAAIFARHRASAAAARAGLEALGFRLFADPSHASQTVTAAWLPEGLDWKTFNGALLERGLVVAGGQGDLSGRIVRLGHLGYVQPDDIVDAIGTMGQVLAGLGTHVDPAAATSAARKAADDAGARAAGKAGQA